jgi:hypothetical protein
MIINIVDELNEWNSVYESETHRKINQTQLQINSVFFKAMIHFELNREKLEFGLSYSSEIELDNIYANLDTDNMEKYWLMLYQNFSFIDRDAFCSINTNNETLSLFFIKRIYAKGKANPKELAELLSDKIKVIIEKIEKSYWGLNNNERTKCDDKINRYGLNQHYGDDNYLFFIVGLTNVIYHHYKNGIIIPIKETDREKEILGNWLIKNREINDDYCEWDELDELNWRFANGGRKRYLDKEINHKVHTELK